MTQNVIPLWTWPQHYEIPIESPESKQLFTCEDPDALSKSNCPKFTNQPRKISQEDHNQARTEKAEDFYLDQRATTCHHQHSSKI